MLGIAPVDPYTASLAWADRIYRHAIPYPVAGNPNDEILDALDAYRAIRHKYSDTAELRRRMALCLSAQGLYDDALKALPAKSPDKTDLRTRLILAEAVRRRFGVTAIQVLPLRDGRFLTLVADRLPWRTQHTVDLDIYELKRTALWLLSAKDPSRPRVIQRKPMDDPGGGPLAAHLYVLYLRKNADPVAMVYEEFEAADRNPTAQTFFRISRGTLRPLQEFGGGGGAQVFPPTGTHGLEVKQIVAWKIYWPDFYEWRGNRFRLANRNHPEAYPLGTLRVDDAPKRWDPNTNSYGDWMWRAAELDIHRRFSEAARAWRHAAALCHRSTPQTRDGTFDYLYGKPQVVLREIRRRLRWLSRHDYGHWLLYRPYDGDLEVDAGYK